MCMRFWAVLPGLFIFAKALITPANCTVMALRRLLNSEMFINIQRLPNMPAIHFFTLAVSLLISKPALFFVRPVLVKTALLMPNCRIEILKYQCANTAFNHRECL